MTEDETYEYACMRADLLGTAPPDKEEFEKARSDRLQFAAEELEASEAALLEHQDEFIKNVGGKLDELNTILSSTQQKLNRFKASACGSLSNMFSHESVDNSNSATPSGAGSRRNTNTSSGIEVANNDNTGNIKAQGEAEDEDIFDVKPVIPTEKIRQDKLNVQEKMSSHLDKLDVLINKAEKAEISMSEQTKQMRNLNK